MTIREFRKIYGKNTIRAACMHNLKRPSIFEKSSRKLPFKDKNTALEKFILVLRQSPDAVFILDKDLNFEFINPSFTQLSGYTENDVLNKSLIDFIYEGKIFESHTHLIETLRKGEKWQGELITIHRSGNSYWVNTIATPYKDEKGNVEGYTVIQQDITEQRVLKEALEHSLKRFRELTEMLPQTVYEMDLNGIQTYMNQAGIKEFKHQESPVGRSAFDFISTEDHVRMKENMLKGIKENNFTTGNEYTGVRTDGTQFPVVVYGAPIYDKNEVVGTRGIIIDNSERKTMENALRESEEKYRTLIEKAYDGIIIVQNGLFKFSNEAFCEMTQYTQNELLDKPFIFLISDEDQQLMSDYHKQRMSGEEFQSIYRTHIVLKDGKTIIVEISSRTTDFNGENAVFVVIRDLTKRLQTEENLLSAQKELKILNIDLERRIEDSSKKLNNANTQLITLQKENLQSQFDVLKQQVNPHFLFNSLNVLTSLIKLEPDLAEKFSEHLSKVYRYVLENKDHELVDMNTELKFLDAYIFLLNIRFVNKLTVNIDIPESKRCYLVIPLAMQLLIENAIKHNIMSKSNPLHIDIFIDKKNFLNIVNNLQERPTLIFSTGIGLKNIQNRYLLLNNTEPVFLKTEKQFIAKVPLVKNE